MWRWTIYSWEVDAVLAIITDTSNIQSNQGLLQVFRALINFECIYQPRFRKWEGEHRDIEVVCDSICWRVLSGDF